MVLRVSYDAIVLFSAGIPLEFIQREHLGQLLHPVIDTSEIAHGSHAGHVEAAADLLGGDNLLKSMDDLGYQTAGDAVIAGQKGIFLKEALAASAAVAALPKVQEGVSPLIVCIR